MSWGSYLEIAGLEVKASIGVLPQERLESQPLLIDMKLFIDFSEARSVQAIQVDYAQVASEVTTFVTQHHVDLIEDLAYRLARYVLFRFKALEMIEVKIAKPQAILNAQHAAVALRVTRKEME